MLLVLSVDASAQEWATHIANHWPGPAVAKATEADFLTFAKQLGRDAKTGWPVFVAAQHQALGLGLPVFVAATSELGGGVPGGTDLVVGETEPNNTAAQANAVNCGDHVEAALGAGDADWFAFTVAAPGLLTLYTNPGPGGTVTDTVLELYDAGLVLLAVNDDSRGLLSTIRGNIGAGNYLARVRHFAAAGTGAYSLDISCGSIPLVVNEGPEPNNTPAGSTPMACGLVAEGRIAVALDSDWYTFTLNQAATLVANTGGAQIGPTLQDSTLTLWDAAGTTQLAFDDDAGPGLFARLVVPLPAGTYHLAVAGYAQSVGRYTLAIDCALGGAATIPEAAEPNNTVATATQFGCNFTGNGDIAQSGDSDYWLFTVTQNARLVVTNGPGTTGIALTDPTLTLRRLDGTQIAFDDDSGPGLYSLLDVEVAQGSYVIDARGYQALTGTYVLDLLCLPGQNLSRATYTVLGGGCPGSNSQVPSWSVRPFEVPLLGTTLTGSFGNAPPFAGVIAFAGFSTTISSSGFPLPVLLGPLGAPGCRVDVDPASVIFLVADANGQAPWSISIPYVLAFVSTDIYQQGLVFDLGANPLGLVSTNSGRGVVGERL
jgi:hypothetical protein